MPSYKAQILGNNRVWSDSNRRFATIEEAAAYCAMQYGVDYSAERRRVVVCADRVTHTFVDGLCYNLATDAVPAPAPAPLVGEAEVDRLRRLMNGELPEIEF